MKRAAVLIPILAIVGGAIIFAWRSGGRGPENARFGRASARSTEPNPPPPPPRSPSPLAPLAKAAGSLRISVFAGGRYAEGARVTVAREGGPGKREFSTVAGGPVTLKDIPAGAYDVTVRLARHVPFNAHADIVANQLTEIRVELRAGGCLQGTVIDERGKALPGTFVRLIDSKTQRFIYPDLQTETDPQGRYVLDGVPILQEFGLNCFNPRYKSWIKTGMIFRDAAETLEVDPVLEQGTTLTGRVLDERGAPIAGAFVMGTNEQNYEANSDAEGRFALYGLGTLPLSMCVRAKGFGTIYPRGIPANSQGLEFRLPKAGEIVCRIEAAPYPEIFAIMLCRYEVDLAKELRLQPQKTENPDGTIVLRDLAPGTYRVEVDAPGFVSQDKPEAVVISGATAGPFTLRLRKAN